MSTHAFLKLLPGVTLKGQLNTTKDIVLSGKFDGELQTMGCLTVAAGGIVTGSIEAEALVLEPGNQVEAKIKVASVPRKRTLEEVRKVSNDKWSGRLKKLKEFALGHK